MIAPEIAATTGRQIPTDVVFSTLSNPRRRHVLHYLKRSDGPVAIGDLAEALAAWENGRSVEEVTSKERKRVYTSLYQSHLPKMHRDGVVSYDAPRGVVELTPAAAQLDIHMEVVDANDIPWSQFYLGLSALSAAVVLALSLGSAVLLEVVGVRLARRLTRRTETTLDDIVFEELRLPLVVTVALAGVYALTRVESVATATLVDARTLALFFGNPSLSVIVLVWARALNRVVNRLVEAVKDRGDRFDFAPVFSNVWTLVVLVGTVAVLLSLWAYDISPLLAGAGIAGIAVGFAAKDTVANFFGIVERSSTARRT